MLRFMGNPPIHLFLANKILKFNPKYSVEYGINEILKKIRKDKVNYKSYEKFGNYKIILR